MNRGRDSSDLLHASGDPHVYGLEMGSIRCTRWLVWLGLMAQLGCASTQISPHWSRVPRQNESEAALGDPKVRVPRVERTLALTRSGFRRCFERVNASGKLALTLTIDGQGVVRQARAVGPVPREVCLCIEERARQAHFEAPEGGRLARLDIPVAVYRQ